MKYYFTLLSLTLVLAACSEKDEQFCACMEAGEAFNEAAAKILQEGTVSTEAQDQFQELKKEKETACANYTSMSGEEMLKRKAECE